MTSAGSLSLTRDPGNGLLTGTVLGTVNDSRGYNGFGEVEDYSANHNSTALLSLHYTRDGLGRITQKTETQGALTTTFAYAYDLAGRLTEVKQNGVATASYEGVLGDRPRLLLRFGAAQPTGGRAWEADFGPKQGWVEERDPAGSRRRG